MLVLLYQPILSDSAIGKAMDGLCGMLAGKPNINTMMACNDDGRALQDGHEMWDLRVLAGRQEHALEIFPGDGVEDGVLGLLRVAPLVVQNDPGLVPINFAAR